LAPDIVASVLMGQTDQVLMLEHLEPPLPASWGEPRKQLAFEAGKLAGGPTHSG